MTEDIKAVNYCTHAMHDVARLSKNLALLAPRSAARLRLLTNVLRNAQKFLLPNRCELLDPESIGQAHLDLLQLPYPCVAFEAPWEGDVDGDYGGMEQEAATRRIALCWTVGPDVLPFFKSSTDPLILLGTEGICVLPIYKIAGAKAWTVASAGLFIPNHSRFIDITDATLSGACERALAAQREAGLARRKSNAIEASMFVFLPEMYDRFVSKLGEEQAQACVLGDTQDEVSMVIQTCAVLNCENVSARELAPAAALNKQRKAKALEPFFTYKVLTLLGTRPSHYLDDLGGTHSSPRTHLRRGHLRRLPGRSLWVRHTMVGGSGGVQKDYRLLAAKSDETVTRYTPEPDLPTIEISQGTPTPAPPTIS